MDTFEPSREEQLTEKKLNWGYWWVTNKLRVRRWVIIALSIFDFIFVGYGIFGYADWFFGSGVVERQQIAELAGQPINYAFFREKNAPQNLTWEGATVVQSGVGAYDYVSRVSNPNRLWWAEFDYSFSAGGGRTQVQRGFVLPLSTRSVAALGVRSESVPSGSDIVIENIQWHRVDQHDTPPDFDTWMRERLQLQISGAEQVAPAATDAVPVHRAKFRVTNASAFGFYRAGFFVTLSTGGRIIGVNKVTISALRAGETRDVEASWFTDLPLASTIEVEPDVNIFDMGNYIAPGQ